MKERISFTKVDKVMIPLLAICVLVLFCISSGLFTKPDSSVSSQPNDSELNEFQLSYKVCVTALGTYPQKFVKTRGEGTPLNDGYTYAEVTADDGLLLRMTDAQLETWKNSKVWLQMLQKLVGAEREVVTQIIPPTDSFYSDIYDEIENYNIEVSEDYSTIISDEEEGTMVPFMLGAACVTMQILEGKDSEDVLVEIYVRLSDGELILVNTAPMYMHIYQDLDECKKLMEYEQTPAEIVEYVDSQIDEHSKDLQYKNFWGMDYRSDDLEYQIFSYEFVDKDNALRYYLNATNTNITSPKNQEKYQFPVDDFDRNCHAQKSYTDNQYEIVVVDGTRAYRLVTSNIYNEITQINEMLSRVFSVRT